GNHQIKPDIGAAIARRWYDVEQVDLIVDVAVSSIGLAVQNVARAASLRSHPGEWWETTRCGKASICHPRPFLVYPAGAGIQSENQRHCQWSARQHKCN